MSKEIKVRCSNVIFNTTMDLLEGWDVTEYFESDEDGIDFEIQNLGSLVDEGIGKLEEGCKLVSISHFNVSSSDRSGEMLYFEFHNCGFPEEFDKLYSDEIFYVNGNPLKSGEDDDFVEASDNMELGEYIKYETAIFRYEDLDFQDLIKKGYY